MPNYITRIKNNQITDSTILANVKIVPGSIVGSLFNSNLTMTSDVTITGNLTVQGSSTYLTVASTNTYVNDPLIVLNNAFSGANQYDLGFIFNRGTSLNQAFYWDESSDEFRLIGTSETGTTYGNITSPTTYANLHVGNITVDYIASVSTLDLTNASLTGNLTVNGNVLVGSNLTANLTINARDINATVIGNVISANATFANVTVDTLTSGRVTYAKANGTLRDDADFTYDDVSNVLSIGDLDFDGANATIKTTGTNQTLIVAPSGNGNVDFSNVRLTYVADPIDLQDVVTKSYLETQLSSAVTNMVLDDTDIYLHDDGIDPGWITSNVDGILVSYTTSNTMALFGSSNASILYVDDSNSNVAVNGTAFIGDDLTVADGGIVYVLDNTDSTAYNSGALQVTGGVGIGANLHVNGIAHITNSTNAIDYNSGALVVDGGAAFEKDVYIKGNLYVDNIAAINYSIISVQDPLLYLSSANTYPYNYDIGFFSHFTGGVGNVYQHTGFARDNADGAWYLFSNVAAEPNGGIDFTGATYDKLVVGNVELRTTTGITTTETTAEIVNTTATTVNLAGAATTFTLGATTGTANIRNANIYYPNATTIYSGQSTISLFGQPTAVNSFTSATQLTLGATTGTANIRNANIYLPNATTIFSGQSTLNFANTVTTTLEIGGNATSILMGNVNGGVGIRGSLTTLGQANVFNSTAATNVGTGALLVYGGMSMAGNLHVGLSANIPSANITSNVSSTSTDTGALTVTGGVGITGNLNIGGQLSFPTANISANTISYSSSTGALIVVGGVGFGSNLNVGGGAVINFDQNTEDFIVKGKYLTRLIHASSTTDTVSIGTSNTTPVSGATLRVGGTGAMMIPIGSTSDRPGTTGNVDLNGMIRLNTSLGTLEYYIGGDWQSSQGSFTVITADQFNGDGANVNYTLSKDATTAGTMVSVNGIIQIPTTSYSVSGNLLTFTEAPAIGDVVDARILTTTTTVTSIVDAFNKFEVTANWANVSTGSAASIPRISTNTDGTVYFANDVVINGSLTVKGDTAGNINIGDANTDNVVFNADVNSNFIPNINITYDLGNVTNRWGNIFVNRIVYDQTVTNAPSTSAVLIDRFATSSYSSAKYMVQSKQGTTSNVQVMEALVVHDSTTAYVTTYGIINTGNAMGTLTANITSGNVNLYFNATSGTVNSNVKVQTTYIV